MVAAAVDKKALDWPAALDHPCWSGRRLRSPRQRVSAVGTGPGAGRWNMWAAAAVEAVESDFDCIASCKSRTPLVEVADAVGSIVDYRMIAVVGHLDVCIG